MAIILHSGGQEAKNMRTRDGDYINSDIRKTEGSSEAMDIMQINCCGNPIYLLDFCQWGEVLCSVVAPDFDDSTEKRSIAMHLFRR